MIGISHEIGSEQMVLRCQPCNFNWCLEWYTTAWDHQREEDLINREISILDQSLTQLNKDEVVEVRIHSHPLYQVKDSNILWENVKNDSWYSLTNKSSLLKPMNFKWVKQNCSFALCSLWTSTHLKRIKKMKGKTWIIF